MAADLWADGRAGDWSGFWASPEGGSVTRRRIGRYVCHVASPVGEQDLMDLLAVFDARRAGGPAPRRNGALAGRSAIWRHAFPQIGAVVVKEYRRGGMLRFIRRRHYLSHGARRPEREVRNLLAARGAGLNVPEPVVGVSRGVFVYRGWLVTRLIEGRSLVDAVSAGVQDLPALLGDLTRQVGLLIERRVAHVDLHPGNVFVGDDGTVYVLDFDRARAFAGPLAALRLQYDVRRRRAVEKHALPADLASV